MDKSLEVDCKGEGNFLDYGFYIMTQVVIIQHYSYVKAYQFILKIGKFYCKFTSIKSMVSFQKNDVEKHEMVFKRLQF